MEELVAWAKDRYRFVEKTFDGFDENGDGVIVYCYGTLNGEWPDGGLFSGIRFIDRFTLSDGKLCDHHVWNDLGEYLSRQPKDRQ